MGQTVVNTQVRSETYKTLEVIAAKKKISVYKLVRNDIEEKYGDKAVLPEETAKPAVVEPPKVRVLKLGK